MQVLMLKPGQAPEIAEIGSDLKSMQDAVGGFIEVAARLPDGACIVCHSEGKMLDLPPNRYLYDDRGRAYDYIAGDAFICGTKGDEFVSLDRWPAEKWSHAFRGWIKEEEYAE